MQRQGIIALDIDGTITGHDHSMPGEVERYLKELDKRGWAILFVTGRSFAHGYEVLQACTFPYTFAYCNGAVVVSMPAERELYRRDLPRRAVEQLRAVAEPLGVDFFVHTAHTAYYRPARFTPDALAYLEERRGKCGEQWIAVKTFDELSMDSFPYAKFFGPRDPLSTLKESLESSGFFHTSLIVDPLRPKECLLLVTDREATKGEAVNHFRSLSSIQGPVIAAGDDTNDLSLLAAADVKVAMATAPKELLCLADIVAPPSRDMGIISGLTQALAALEETA